MFEKLAYFINGDIEFISAKTALRYDRIVMAEMFSKLPHVIDTMPISDYWDTMEVSNARSEANEFNKDIGEAWDL